METRISRAKTEFLEILFKNEIGGNKIEHNVTLGGQLIKNKRENEGIVEDVANKIR